MAQVDLRMAAQPECSPVPPHIPPLPQHKKEHPRTLQHHNIFYDLCAALALHDQDRPSDHHTPRTTANMAPATCTCIASPSETITLPYNITAPNAITSAFLGTTDLRLKILVSFAIFAVLPYIILAEDHKRRETSHNILIWSTVIIAVLHFLCAFKAHAKYPQPHWVYALDSLFLVLVLVSALVTLLALSDQRLLKKQNVEV
ncbi:uncharacterized protein LTR77_008362 [Saxophila tyrrhenica]|uniref:Uncharacterized protein n=1 Tax=Saxophila tyrrhenica TaxID=1690608 RepID=A0AAV9P152_9PEZI|nr:hypothetical protein LTR77_008362 [Saxophila tyrrhenica]